MAKQIDVLVIGAGIAGITAGIYLKRSSLEAVVLDKGAPGGKLNNIHRIDNYPGTPTIAGPDLAATLVNQAFELGVALDYGDVFEVTLQEDGQFKIRTDNGDYLSKAVIVATGSSPKKLGVAGEKEFLGHGVSYCATCDGNFFKGGTVAVYGYMDHAVEDTLYLAGIVKQVYFIAPKEISSTETHLAAMRALDNVTEISGATVTGIYGEDKVSEISYRQGDEEKRLPVDAIFPLADEKSSTEFLSSLNVESNKGFLVVNSNMETNVPGLYACGDIIDKKLRQLVNAAGEASVAATSAISRIRSLKK